MTEWPDLVGKTWIFTQVAEQIGNKADENPAALRIAVFSVILENRRVCSPPQQGKG